MKKHAMNHGSRSGSILTTVVILLGVASFGIGAILWAMNGFVRHTERNHDHDRALLLADAGVAAAMTELNYGGDGAITTGESKQLFSSTGRLDGANWNFMTSITMQPDSGKKITSQGTYRDAVVTVEKLASVQASGETIHALYALAIYAGNSSGDTNYTLEVGGSGSDADFVNGDVHVNGGIALSGGAMLRHPEDFTDLNSDELWDANEEWLESNATTVFSNPLSQAEFDTYVAGLDQERCYGNDEYDHGEAFVDLLGNSVYDSSEPFEDLNGDGIYGFGEPFDDLDGDGVRDEGEEFIDLGNGEYDEGEEYEDVNGNGQWDPEIPGHYEGSGWGRRWVPTVPAEPFEDRGNGVYDEGESFVDVNGVYDEGEPYCDDRNGCYDYGTTATGEITGMPDALPGQQAADGSDPQLDPPDLSKMYYNVPKTDPKPIDASENWGYDEAVADATFDGSGKLMDQDDPRHIFVKNPSWGYASQKNVGDRDDYFLEDPTDASYGDSHQYLTVLENGNDKVYYVDGNLYIHNPDTYDFMFRNAGIRMTVVAKGNITISDEFWYNGGTDNPQDAVCFIALEDDGNPSDTGGNIYLGDSVYGTGGDIHAMLFAENDFVDNNLDTTGQPYLSVFGNMTAGNHVDIDRSAPGRTRLDVGLDERIREGVDVPPGLPPSLSGQRQVYTESGWEPDTGTWSSYSRLQ